MTRIILGLVTALTLLAAPAAVATPPDADATPVTFTFTKSDPEGDAVWVGHVGGAGEGLIQTNLVSARSTGPIVHVEFLFEVFAGEQSFLAELSGTLNTTTGAVALHGTVVAGASMLGARVVEHGQLVDPETSTFEGTITLIPRNGS